MGEDQLKKFIDNMRAAGQPDDMIAESLINAGNNKLMVLNTFGVSSIEELVKEPEPVEGQPDEDGAIPIIDEHGNLSLKNEEHAQVITTHSDSHPKPLTAHPRPGRQYTRDHKPIILKRERTTQEEPSNQEPVSDGSTEPAKQQQVEEVRISEGAATLKEHIVIGKRRVFNANILHGQKHDVPQMPRTPHKATVPTKKRIKPLKKVETQTETEAAEAAAQHAHHHNPHTFKETMEDLTEHKELEAGFDAEIQNSNPTLNRDILPPVSKVSQNQEHGRSMKASTAPQEPQTSNPSKEQPTSIQKEWPENDIPEEELVELPQEIKVDELESIGAEDTRELKKVTKEALEKNDTAQANPKTPAAVDLKQPLPDQPSVERVGSNANNLLHNTALLASLVLLGVVILIALAASVGMKVINQ